MIYRNPFALPGRFYRGNAHAHSTFSDGALKLEDRFEAYRERGYDFLVMTDHNTTNPVDHCSRDGFLAVPGIELHPPNPYGGETYHIVGIGVGEMIDPVPDHPNDVIAAINDQGGLAIMAHPYWCGHTLLDFVEVRGYIGIEVYNTTCCVSIGKGHSESHWDDLLDRVGPVVGLAVDDCHRVTEDAFQGWVMVKAEELTVPAVLNAIRTGAFYSTQGPEIKDLRIEMTPTGPSLQVSTSPVNRIAFKARAYNGDCLDAQDGELLTAAECPMLIQHGYLRVEITAPDGKKAWSNPFLVSDYV
jgi:hypothetical protein